MQLRNHIVYRFLSEPSVVTKAAIGDYEREVSDVSDVTKGIIAKMCSIENNRSYYITKSITDKVPLLKTNTNWDVLKGRPDGKYTFIFNDNSFLRMVIDDTDLLFVYFIKHGKGNISNSYFFVSFQDDKKHGDFAGKEDFWFKFLCFFFLSENDERIVNGGRSYGTKKQADALSNDCPYPITIVNSNWNVTSIRNEQFPVSGHFRMQRVGQRRSETRVKFIEPFIKHGYIRKATRQ